MTSPTPAKPLYPHLDGIRGLAIALVVIFHVFVGKVSSGVDVFLFIGGLLLLSSQLRNASSLYGRTFLQSLVRILRRLLPALVTVVGATIAGILLLFSRVELGTLFTDASASLLHWVNWRLISTEADYDAASSKTTPFQHLWSMSAQLQIYVVILVVVFFVHWVMTRKSKQSHGRAEPSQVPSPRWRRIAITVLGVMTAASFVYAGYLNLSGHQPVNYYSTLSRFWEIGVGGLVGLVVFSVRPSALLSRALSWTGFTLIFSVGIFFDGVEQFPGPLTLVPIAGALCLVIAGLGTQVHRPVIIRCLESPGAAILGKLAYSLYLWHWPLLILGVKATGLEAKNPVLGIPVIALSLGLAWLTYRYVETPLREKPTSTLMNTGGAEQNPTVHDTSFATSSSALNAAETGNGPNDGPGDTTAVPAPRRWRVPAAGLAIGFILIVLSPQAVSVAASVQKRIDESRIAEAVAEGREDTYPGAAEILDDITPREDVPIYPSLVDRGQMMPPATNDDCTTEKDSTEIVDYKVDGSACQYGDTAADRTMYLVGGSHSEQWLGALDQIGQDRGIKIVPFLRSGCPLFYGDEDDPGCDTWSQNVEQRILDSPPSDGVFMVSTRPEGGSPTTSDYVPDEYRDVFNRIARADISIFAIRDNPWLRDDDGEQLDPRVCVTQDPTLSECTVPADAEYSTRNPAEDVLTDERIVHLDLTDSLVKDQAVHPVIGNVLVYRDWNHLTDQYVRTLAPELDRQMYPEDSDGR